MLAYLLIAGSLCQDCESLIVHEGAICDVSNNFTLSDNKTAFCQGGGNPDNLLDFCRISICSVCDNNLDPCSALINSTEGDSVAKKFTVGGATTACTVSSGENCYRSNTQDEYFVAHYQDSSDAVQELPACCILECADKFNSGSQGIGGGCGSNGQHYNSINDFCTAFCNNRSLAFAFCGTANCGADQGCSTDCASSFPSTPVCSDTNVLYTSADSYCQDLSTGIVNSFVTCGLTGCTEDDCNMNACIKSFADANYDFINVCDTNSDIYPSVQIFCAQNNQGVISDTVSCNGEECTEDTCCLAACIADTKNSLCLISSETVVEPAEYCANICKGVVGQFTECLDDNENPTGCTDSYCSVNYCINNLPGVGDEDPVCASDNKMYASNFDFCNAKIENDGLRLIYCEDGLCQTDNECCKRNCALNNPSFQPLCDVNFKQYSTDQDFCDAQCSDAGVEVLACGDANCTLDECCINRCNQQPFGALCTTEPSVSLLSDQGTFCLNSCKDRNYYNLTYVCSGPCSEQDCELLQCNRDIENSPHCGSNGAFYPDGNQFCGAQNVNPNLKERLCENDSPCATADDCCVANCLENNQYDFCVAGQALLATTVDYCNDTCKTKKKNYLKCQNESGTQIACTQDICQLYHCVSLVGTLAGDNAVCGSDSKLYSTRLEFCKAQARADNLEFVRCGNELCLTENKCCEQNCASAYLDFQPICDTNFKQYNTAEDFCSSKCQDTNVAILTCDSQNCSISQCCEAQCKQQPFEAVCVTQPSLSLVEDQDQYCSKLCVDPIFSNSIQKCDGACTIEDCQSLSCDGASQQRPYCGNDGKFYETAKDYCAALSTKTVLNETICDNNQPCTTTDDCCRATCIAKSSSSFQPRCNTSFVLLDSVERYCNDFCTNPNYQDLTCGDQQTLCTQAECCNQSCLTNEYQPVCGSNFALIRKEDYCKGRCEDINFKYTTCEGGCTTEKCADNPCNADPYSIACLYPACARAPVQNPSPLSWLCASDGNLYRNECVIQQSSLTKSYSCEDLVYPRQQNVGHCRQTCASKRIPQLK